MSIRFSRLVWDLPLLVLLWLFPARARSQPPQRAASAAMESDFQAAMAAEDRGDMERAQALLSRLHNEHPGIFAVDESLGLLFARREDFRRALPLLQAAVREQPASDVAHANLGATLYKLHRTQAALGEFERAVHINPRNFSAQESLGRLSMETRRPDEAAKAFLAAVRLKPEDGDLQLDCATALLAAHHVDEAQKMLSTLAGGDQSARAQSLWGEVDERQGKFQEAGKHFERAVQLEPSEENIWDFGVELLRHWAFEVAAVEFQAATKKFPASKRLRLGLAAAFFGNAQYSAAVPVFADLLASEPNNAMYAEFLGIACNAPMDAVNPRCETLLHYALAHTSDVRAATYAASFLMKRRDNFQNVEIARKLLEHALAVDPNLPEAQLQMGAILQESSNWKGSIPYLERALKLKPNLAQAHYRLARAYWKTGRKVEAQVQMNLQKKYASQEQEDLHRRMQEITSLAVTVQP